jgi:uncharacterized protein (TIGR02453 family)
MRWFVYLVRCRDGSLYTGVSTDPRARVRAHNAGRGAKYTRSRRPVALAHVEPTASRSAALRREWAIKQLSRRAKERLLSALPPGEVPMSEFTGFGLRAFGFFRQLKRQNTKAWFEAHRDIYEAEVRSPLRNLVEEVDVLLSRLAPEMVGDPRRSIFRIHRDIRFSRDKSPYKTNAACWFYHQDAGRGIGGEAAHGGAGFYFHLSSKECYLGGGIWMPPRPALAKIRTAIAENPEEFGRLVDNRSSRRRFGQLDEEGMLKRLPRGYEPGHPAERWLRYQSFTCGRELTRREAQSAQLPRILARDFARLLPLIRWLNNALGYPPARSRL